MDHLVELLRDLIPVLTLILGAILTYFVGVKSKKRESELKYKEEQYSKLLIKLQGFVGETANAELKREFFEEQYKSWLFCSDEVVTAINTMVDFVIENKRNDSSPNEGFEIIGNIVLAMRKDLYGKTKLGWDSFKYRDVHG